MSNELSHETSRSARKSTWTLTNIYIYIYNEIKEKKKKPWQNSFQIKFVDNGQKPMKSFFLVHQKKVSCPILNSNVGCRRLHSIIIHLKIKSMFINTIFA